MIFSRTALFSSAIALFLGSVLASDTTVPSNNKPQYVEPFGDIVQVVPNANSKPLDLLTQRVEYYVDGLAKYTEDVLAKKKVEPKKKPTYPSSWRPINKPKVDSLLEYYPVAFKTCKMMESVSNDDDVSVLDFKRIVDWSVKRCGTDNSGYFGPDTFKRHKMILTRIDEIFAVNSPSYIKYVYGLLREKYLKASPKPEQWGSDEMNKALNAVFTTGGLDKKKNECIAEDEKAADENSNSSSSSSSSSSAVSDSESSSNLSSDFSSSSLSSSSSSSSTTPNSSSSTESTTVTDLIKGPTKDKGGLKSGAPDGKTTTGTNNESKNNSNNNDNAGEDTFWTPLTITLVAAAGLAIIAVIVVVVVKSCCKSDENGCDVDDKV